MKFPDLGIPLGMNKRDNQRVSPAGQPYVTISPDGVKPEGEPIKSTFPNATKAKMACFRKICEWSEFQFERCRNPKVWWRQLPTAIRLDDGSYTATARLYVGEEDGYPKREGSVLTLKKAAK